MNLSGEAESLARELADLAGSSPEEAVRNALRDQLTRKKEIAEKLERIRKINEHFMSLPVLDPRSPDEIIGYNEYGVPE